MSRVLIYNPDNDLALASGLRHFTPPRAGRMMAEAGSLLPFWWADEGDCVIVPQQHCSEAENLKRLYGLCGTTAVDTRATPSPWGWSPAIRQRLLDMGFPPDSMPSEPEIQTIRDLSHRRISIEIHRTLSTPDALMPVEAFSIDEAAGAINTFGADAVVKTPWSCSGRGVFFTRDTPRKIIHDRISASIQRQGSVIIEPRYDGVTREAAALFHCADTVRLKGFSTFRCNESGNYAGNLVASQKLITDRCGSAVVDAGNRLAPILNNLLAGKYQGWLGVDMLVHRSGVNPCMELNLRMTMGVVAMFIADKLLSRGETARILTSPAPPACSIILSPASCPLKVALVKE